MKAFTNKPVILIGVAVFFVILVFIWLIVLNKNKRNETEVRIKTNEIPNKSITLDQLKVMFKNMESDVDVSKPLLWWYFFTNHDSKPLYEAKEKLIKKWYRFVDIYISNKQNENQPDLWWLHIEKEEIHSPESLDKRNDEFYIFANEMGLNSYDWMDVWPILK